MSLRIWVSMPWMVRKRWLSEPHLRTLTAAYDAFVANAGKVAICDFVSGRLRLPFSITVNVLCVLVHVHHLDCGCLTFNFRGFVPERDSFASFLDS